MVAMCRASFIRLLVSDFGGDPNVLFSVSSCTFFCERSHESVKRGEVQNTFIRYMYSALVCISHAYMTPQLSSLEHRLRPQQQKTQAVL